MSHRRQSLCVSDAGRYAPAGEPRARTDGSVADEMVPGFLEHCEARWRYVQDANSGAIDREMERQLWWWSIRRYGHPKYIRNSSRNFGASKERTKVKRNFLIASCLVLF